MIERSQSLSKWALEIGVHRHTLRRWLAAEGILMPHVALGGKVLIRERHIEIVLRKRLTRQDLSLIRGRKVA